MNHSRRAEGGQPRSRGTRGVIGVDWVLGLSLLAATGTVGSALAASGETGDTIGTYRARKDSCDVLRSSSGVGAGAFTLACNAKNRSTAGIQQPCDIQSLTTLVRGSALGFCEDKLPNVRPVKFPTGAPTAALEAGKTLRGSAYGVNTGIQKDGPVDVVCTTFSPSDGVGANAAQGIRACREVVVGPGEPPQCNDGPGGTWLPTIKDENACRVIREQLAATITGNEAPELTHALLFSALEDVGTRGSQALFVCGGYTARCTTASSIPAAGATAIEYQIEFGVLQTPGCGFTRSGYRCW
jgi:hypothetical protein